MSVPTPGIPGWIVRPTSKERGQVMVSATLTRPADQVATYGYLVNLVERYFSCVDDNDLEGVLDCFTEDAVLTIHDMRSLLECISFVRRTAVQTAVHVITTGVLIALLTGIAMK